MSPDIFTKAEKAATKKLMKEAVRDALRVELSNEAHRIVRRWIKENRDDIDAEVCDQFNIALEKATAEIVKDALSKTHLYIDT